MDEILTAIIALGDEVKEGSAIALEEEKGRSHFPEKSIAT